MTVTAERPAQAANAARRGDLEMSAAYHAAVTAANETYRTVYANV